MACDTVLLDGKDSPVPTIDWKSWKLKRVCRSSLCCRMSNYGRNPGHLELHPILLGDHDRTQHSDHTR
eukprot:9154062-Lingulodinium_polyedra.AAC.1